MERRFLDFVLQTKVLMSQVYLNSISRALLSFMPFALLAIVLSNLNFPMASIRPLILQFVPMSGADVCRQQLLHSTVDHDDDDNEL